MPLQNWFSAAAREAGVIGKPALHLRMPEAGVPAEFGSGVLQMPI